MSLLNQETRLRGAHYRILLFAWGTWFTGFSSLTLFSFLLKPIQLELTPSERELAWLTGVAIGASGVGGLLFGWLADRWGRRRSIALAIATFSLANLLCALAPSALALAAARALCGLGVGGSWGAGQTLLGETFPAALRGRFGAIAQSGAPLGLGLATIAGSYLAPVYGWRVIFGSGALAALLLLLVRWVPESDIWGKQSGRERILLPLVSRPGLAGSFWKCLLLTLLNMSAYWFTVSWLPKYLQQERGLSQAASGNATLFFVVGSLSGYLAFGWLSDRLGRRISFSLFCALAATGLIGFTVLWPYFAARPSLIFGFLFLSGLGTGTWSGYGPLFSEIFPTSVRGTALSVTMNLARGVQFVAPVVIGAVAPRWGMAGGIALAAGFAIATGLWVWTLPETRGRVISA